jgi:putative exporter of polyketide antibiotics
VVAWSFLVELIGGLINASHWLLDTSVLHHMTLAPAVPPDWRTNATVLAVGLASGAVGVFAFSHRDLAGN